MHFCGFRNLHTKNSSLYHHNHQCCLGLLNDVYKLQYSACNIQYTAHVFHLLHRFYYIFHEIYCLLQILYLLTKDVASARNRVRAPTRARFLKSYTLHVLNFRNALKTLYSRAQRSSLIPTFEIQI